MRWLVLVLLVFAGCDGDIEAVTPCPVHGICDADAGEVCHCGYPTTCVHPETGETLINCCTCRLPSIEGGPCTIGFECKNLNDPLPDGTDCHFLNPGCERLMCNIGTQTCDKIILE